MKSYKHIADRIRLLIATRQFQVGEVLPSTRVLGKQLEASFHTVRKAYQLLAEEGLLESNQRGYVVSSPRTLLDKSERLEKGAEKFRQLLEELIGYGLDEEEIETLFQEQLNFVDWPERIQACATAGPTVELAQMLAGCIKQVVGVKSAPITAGDISGRVNFDAILVPLRYYHGFASESDDARIIPIVFGLSYDLMLSVAERAGLQSVVLLAMEAESLPFLEEELSQILRAEVKPDAYKLEKRSLPGAAYKADLVFYTPGCARVAEAALPERKRRLLSYELNPRSAAFIRGELWEEG
ncbi:MAG: GntR family transcriptional regulator [Candidatus Cyclonatronum sp.]|uniref:GntR family transcriptional regulator n=1 Tax=Cyclonatronum sp. TaxID=3024185 RepID=UPI0025C5B987|nr:GntR family transcriptional regulator [Cyclonatronum sp.]MCC5933280.1 GntR family transcriptional regulator [Balneolales bacterium]MCH8485399.1 GntR family transcriptional regulator [Cyclonatronum sp.]